LKGDNLSLFFVQVTPARVPTTSKFIWQETPPQSLIVDGHLTELRTPTESAVLSVIKPSHIDSMIAAWCCLDKVLGI